MKASEPFVGLYHQSSLSPLGDKRQMAMNMKYERKGAKDGDISWSLKVTQEVSTPRVWGQVSQPLLGCPDCSHSLAMG